MLPATQAQSLIDELEQLARSGGFSDPVARESAKRLLFQLRAAPGPVNLVHEKVDGLRGWIDVLFSDRKHQEYGGTDRVRSFIFADCASLRRIVGVGEG